MDTTRTRLLFTAAPLVLLAGQVVHPEEPTEGAPLFDVLAAHRTSWLVAHLLLLAGVVSLGPIALRLAREVRDAAPRLSLLSAVVGVAGSGAAAALFGGSLALTEAGRGPKAEMVPLLDRVLDSPVQALFLLVPGMLVAFAVTTAVLAVAGVLSRVTAALVTVGFAVGLGAPEPVACIGTALLAVGLWRTAGALGQRTSAPRSALPVG